MKICSGDEVYDAKSYLVVPQCCEKHIPFNHANTAGKPRDNQSGTLYEAIIRFMNSNASALASRLIALTTEARLCHFNALWQA